MSAFAAATATGYAIYFIIRVSSGHWLLTEKGGLGPTDFTAFWSAGRLAAEGHSASAYNWTDMGRLLGPAAGHFSGITAPFFYPPTFLLLLWPLSALAPGAAVACWILGGLAAYLFAAYSVLPRFSALLLAAAAPAVFSCLCMGQNGLLTAACFAGALALQDRRPIVAGLLIGLLSCKPQLGIMIPFALAASGRWRVAVMAAATVLTLASASALVFGWPAWAAFIEANHNATGLCEVLIQKGQGLYAFMRLCGVPIQAAWIVQAAVACGCLAFVVGHWRSSQPLPLKAAGLIGATMLALPYSFAYDFPITALAVLFILSEAEGRTLDALDAISLFLVLILPVAVLSPSLVALAVLLILLTAKTRSRMATISVIMSLIVAVPVLTLTPGFCVGPAMALLLLGVASRRWIDSARLSPVHAKFADEMGSADHFNLEAIGASESLAS